MTNSRQFLQGVVTLFPFGSGHEWPSNTLWETMMLICQRSLVLSCTCAVETDRMLDTVTERRLTFRKAIHAREDMLDDKSMYAEKPGEVNLS